MTTIPQKLQSKSNPFLSSAKEPVINSLMLDIPTPILSPKKIAGAISPSDSFQPFTFSPPANSTTLTSTNPSQRTAGQSPLPFSHTFCEQMSLSSGTFREEFSKNFLDELNSSPSREEEESDSTASTPRSTSSSEESEDTSESPKSSKLPADYNLSPLKMEKVPELGRSFSKAIAPNEQIPSRPPSQNPITKLTRNIERTFSRIYSQKTTPEILLKRKQYTPLRMIGQGNSSTVFEGLAADGARVAMKFMNTQQPIPFPSRLRVNRFSRFAAFNPSKIAKEKNDRKGELPENSGFIKAKIDLSRTTQDEADLRNGEIETATLKKVRDVRHAVKLIDSYESSAFELCNVMELLPDSIDLLMKKEDRTFTLAEIAVIAKQLLECLSDLKKLNIPHGDFTPANISLDPRTLQVKVFDFGASRVVFFDSEKRYYDFCAPEYSAPELSLKKQYDCSIDIWSLGVLLVNIYCKTKLVPTEEEEGTDRRSKEKLSDDLHAISRYIGLPSVSFVTSTKLGKHIFSIHDGRCQFKKPPTRFGATYLPKENLEDLIARSAKDKGESPQTAAAFIAFVKKMIAYENRAEPDILLKDDFLN